MKKLRFNAPPGSAFFSGPQEGQAISSFVLRETGSDDEETAVAAAVARNEKQPLVQPELIALAFVQVNGRSVTSPYDGYRHWNTRARTFARKAYERVNGQPDEKADEAFLAAAEDFSADGGPPAAGAKSSPAAG